MTSTSFAARSDARTTHAMPTKSRSLRRLLVSADPCPQVFLRVLDQIALRGMMPFNVEYQRGDESMFFAITTDVPAAQADGLLAKTRSIVAVRSAELL